MAAACEQFVKYDCAVLIFAAYEQCVILKNPEGVHLGGLIAKPKPYETVGGVVIREASA